jgi:hypothetical protein
MVAALSSLLLMLISSSSSFFSNAYAQTTEKRAELQTYIDGKLDNSIGDVTVFYDGNNTIVLNGDALTSTAARNEKFWAAIELLEHDLGYKLDKLVVNGIGSEANPERFYVIMTK